MTEYLLCVSLVYIPIACWIAYLLHRDGFNIKTIILVLALSYLMITAFPLSIQHLGAGVTIMVYGIMLAILTIVMCKPEIFNLRSHDHNLGAELATKPSLNVTDGENQIPAPAPEKSTKVDKPFQAGIFKKTDNPNNISGKQEEFSDQAANLSSTEDLTAKMADGTNNIDVGMPALNKDEAIQTSDDISPAVTNIVIKEELATAMEGDDSLHKDSHEEVLTEHQEELKHPDDGIAAQASSKTAQEESGAEKVIMENETDHQPEEALLVPEQPAEVVQELYSLPLNEDEVPETAMDQPVDLSPPVAEPVIASDTTSPEDSPDIVDWIELGFEAKSQGEYRLAAQNFTFALQSSIDNELKYLLGMELVSIYQNIGDYEQAVIIIDHLLQDIGIQSAAVVELKQQRQYIRLLADELDRLGISGTPIFEVPRFVRIKVNEKMLA